MQLVIITALGVGMATVFGSFIGFALKKIPHRFNDITLSFAAGIMLAAAVLGLIIPAMESGEGGKQSSRCNRRYYLWCRFLKFNG